MARPEIIQKVFDAIHGLVQTRADRSLSNLSADGEKRLGFNQETGGQTGYTLFDIKASDHILSYEHSFGWVREGEYVYSDAETGVHLGYPTFYERCLKEYNNGTSKAYYHGSDVIKVGAIKDTNGLISGFSGTNYLQLPFTFGEHIKSNTDKWEWIVEFTTGDDLTTNRDIMTDNGGFAVHYANSHFTFFLKSDIAGTSWDLANATPGGTTLTINTKYLVKLIFNGSAYKVLSSTNNGNTWVEEVTVEHTGVSVNLDNHGAMGRYSNNIYTDGTINLNNSSFTVNGTTVWNPAHWYNVVTSAEGHAFYDIAEENYVKDHIKIHGAGPMFGMDVANRRVLLPKVLERRLVKAKDATTTDPSWFRLYNDGWLEQGGKTGAYGTSGNVNVTFPVTFTEAPHSVILTIENSTAQYAATHSSDVWVVDETLTTNGFTIAGAGINSFAVTGIFWETAGYTDVPETQTQYLYYCTGNSIVDVAWVEAVAQSEAGVAEIEKARVKALADIQELSDNSEASINELTNTNKDGINELTNTNKDGINELTNSNKSDIQELTDTSLEEINNTVANYHAEMERLGKFYSTDDITVNANGSAKHWAEEADRIGAEHVASAEALKNETDRIGKEWADETERLGKFYSTDDITVNTEGSSKYWAEVSKEIIQLDVGDIGVAVFPIDESKGLRRYLNGSTLIFNERNAYFREKLEKAITTHPSLLCTIEQWDTLANASELKQCGKFAWVYDTDGTTIIGVRLPKIVMPIQNSLASTTLGEYVKSGLPQHTHNYTEMYWGSAGGKIEEGRGNPDYGYWRTSKTTNASSGIYGRSTTVQQEQVQYPYYIQIATGLENDEVLTRSDLEVNSPYSLGMCQYFAGTNDNPSWLLSKGQWNSGDVYTSFYEMLLTEMASSSPKLSVKASTGSYSNTDFVINTTDRTFRLPLIVSGARYIVESKAPTASSPIWYKLWSDGWLEQGGRIATATDKTGYVITYPKVFKDMGYTISTTTYTTETKLNSSQPDRISAMTTSNFTMVCDMYGGQFYWQASGNGTVTTAQICSKNLYFYVGDTVQNASLINVGRIEENIIKLQARHHIKATYQNGDSGYIIWSNGYCEQWGRFSWSDNARKGPIALLKTMKDTNYFVHTTTMSTSSGANDTVCIDTREVSQFYLNVYSSYRDVMWRVHGFLADGQY